MKAFFLISGIFLALTSSSQYYYKDVLGTKESADLINTYRNNKVRSVIVNTYDGENTRLENVFIQQQFSPVTLALTTISRSAITNKSILTSFIDGNGRVIKTVDSSNISVSKTIYSYNAGGQLTSISISSSDSAKAGNESEEHIWQYKDNRIVRMLRIKNKIDTTYVDFKLDEKGNVIEEQETRKGKKSIPYLYYYDSENRLTDIVRYNAKARRLLPEYMFEYSPENQVIQRITVPANTGDYIIWRYQFDQRGLKVKEAIYNKQKQLTGKVEYQYSFGS